MTTYEQKIEEFARGKQLARLARPVRDRADAFCDACGSTQPRVLYALKDEANNRYYFVGDNCLRELARRGVVMRRFCKEAAHEAYRREMERRGLEPDRDGTAIGSGSRSTPGNGQKPLPSAGDASPRPASQPSILVPAVLVTESAEHYEVVVSMVRAGDRTCGWGYAKENRYEEVWGTEGEGALLLQKVKQERPHALFRCVTRAWRDAASQLDGADGELPPLSGTADPERERSLPGLFGVLLGLASTNNGDRRSSPALGDARSGDVVTRSRPQ